MKKDLFSEIIVTICIFAMVVRCGIYIYDKSKVTKYEELQNRERAYIGGITVGMDSTKAVDKIRRRLTSLGYDGSQIKFGDSTGYYLPNRNESYYVMMDDSDHTVDRVYFHSDSLTDTEAEIIARGNRYSRYKSLYHKGNRWTSFQDGNGTFIIYKNK